MENYKKTLNEILEIVSFIKGTAASQQSVDELNGRMGRIEERVEKLGGTVEKLKRKVSSIEDEMVTKVYLDDKLANLQDDLTVLVRKENTRLKTLVEILADKEVIGVKDKKRSASLQPFPSV